MLPVRALLVDFDGTACLQDVSELFAKDALVQICEQDGVPFLPWETFDDVRNGLETLRSLPGPVDLEPCLGWTTA